MKRRSVLRGALATVGVALAGCLGEDDDETILDEPDRDLPDDVDVDPADFVYPGYGEELPDVTVPSPFHDTEISTREFVGSRETLLTFIFTRCPGPCPALTASLAQAQVAAMDGGYADEVVFMPVTFDPEFDDAERLREFAEINGADPTADNWHFLRPESPEHAESVVDDTFGVRFEEVPVEEGGHGGHDDQDGDDDHGETLDPDAGETTFAHTNLLLLVNRDGFVERAYHPQPPRPDIVIEDLETVREGYE